MKWRRCICSIQTARSRLHESAENREMTLACDTRIVEALERRDPDAAEAAVEAFIDALLAYFETSGAGEAG